MPLPSALPKSSYDESKGIQEELNPQPQRDLYDGHQKFEPIIDLMKTKADEMILMDKKAMNERSRTRHIPMDFATWKIKKAFQRKENQIN